MKKLILFTLTLTLLLGAIPISSYGYVTASGTYGDNITWEIDNDYTLTIRGYGPMENNIHQYMLYPWHGYLFSKVIIEEGVTSIADEAFSSSPFQEIVIPNSVTEIGDFAFAASYMTDIHLPANVSVLGKGLFSGCTLLNNITVDSNNPYYTSVNGNLFNRQMTKIIQYARANPDISYIIPQGVTEIGEYAFSEAKNLQNIDIPNSVTSIGENAFHECSELKSINLPNSVASIGKYAFAICKKLIGANIPNGVTTLDGTFNQCASLSEIVIPDSVTAIADNTFMDCNNLKSVYIPASVTSIGDSAFACV